MSTGRVLTPHIVALASNVAMEQHHGQVRKYTGEPYWNHCHAVATLVARWGGTPEMIAASYLHDTIEDTDMTFARLEEIFGSVVTDLVRELTDQFTKAAYPQLNRAARKEREAGRIGEISLQAKVIKCADMMDNSASIEQHDPNFARVYLREKARVAQQLDDARDAWIAANGAKP